jgi:adenylate kinase
VKALKRVILISGTPGVGKSSVSRLLARQLTAMHVNISKLAEREQLIHGKDQVRGTLIADTDELSKRIQSILRRSESDVIVDGHYAVDVVQPSDVHVVFVLRRDPDELKSILDERGFTGNKLWENLSAEILDVCLWDAIVTCGEDKVCEIDVSGKNIEETVDEILLTLNKKKKLRIGRVDWLGKLAENGRLTEFLKPF